MNYCELAGRRKPRPIGRMTHAQQDGTTSIQSLGTAAEFFAGIGLVRMALELAGWKVGYANDISQTKRNMYVTNFDAREFDLRDIRDVRGVDIPTVELATASFPCIDLSLAGKHHGLAGASSGLLWQFLRVMEEMGDRRPKYLLIENVPNFLKSKGGNDLTTTIRLLNKLGYSCDIILADAKWHLPQSRRRLFVICWASELQIERTDWKESEVRPRALQHFVKVNRNLDINPLAFNPPVKVDVNLRTIVEHLDRGDDRWWDTSRAARFRQELSIKNEDKLEAMKRESGKTWATAYRRTRSGRSAWEIRTDGIAGCLRTASGGSSKQALVEVENRRPKIRWMTPLEYSRLQGAEEYKIPETVSNNQALFGFGDAVCVPTVHWVLQETINRLQIN